MKNKKLKKIIFFSIFIILFLSINIVYAKTSAKINFCDYSGVRRGLKVLGMFIVLAKIIVPVIIIITGIKPFFQAATNGGSDELAGAFKTLFRQIAAGIIIFFIPGIIDYVITGLVGYSDSGFSQCEKCVLDINSCTIPDTDPEYYEDD